MVLSPSQVVVIRPRLERGTVCLEGRCSIQLSYRTIVNAKPCALRPVFCFASAKLRFFHKHSKNISCLDFTEAIFCIASY